MKLKHQIIQCWKVKFKKLIIKKNKKRYELTRVNPFWDNPIKKIKKKEKKKFTVN